SSSVSSHMSSETGNLLILADGMLVENPEEFYRMQVSGSAPPPLGDHMTIVTCVLQASPSSSSLNSTHSAPSHLISSAPSTIRVASPSLPDKSRHNRETLLLLPPQQDRPSSAVYGNLGDGGQPTSLQRALFHQVIGSFKPCSDPSLCVGEK
ncbi:unnamed protein product, partial [Tetraodon nigroviridis]